MKRDVRILIAEDDDGHYSLVEKNLRRAGICNPISRFADGSQALEFFFSDDPSAAKNAETAYLLLLDIRMPRVDGVEVLKRLREDESWNKMPIIMLTTTDDPREISRCSELGCSVYIVKPVEYEAFVEAVRKVGLFLSVVEVPQLNEA